MFWSPVTIINTTWPLMKFFGRETKIEFVCDDDAIVQADFINKGKSTH